MFERFTASLRRILVHAQDEARKLSQNFIGTEHFLLAIIKEGDLLAAQVLAELDLTYEKVMPEVLEHVPPGSPPELRASPPFTPRAKKLLELSLREAMHLGDNFIGPEHLLLGLIREGEGVGATVIIDLGVELETVRQAVLKKRNDPQSRAVAKPKIVDDPPPSIHLDLSLEEARTLHEWIKVHGFGVQNHPLSPIATFLDQALGD